MGGGWWAVPLQAFPSKKGIFFTTEGTELFKKNAKHAANTKGLARSSWLLGGLGVKKDDPSASLGMA